MKYVRNNTIYAKKINDKWYILENDKRAVRELNEIGSLIWEALVEPCTIENIVGRICEEYKVEPRIAQKDALEFVIGYVKEGYIAEV